MALNHFEVVDMGVEIGRPPSSFLFINQNGPEWDRGIIDQYARAKGAGGVVRDSGMVGWWQTGSHIQMAIRGEEHWNGSLIGARFSARDILTHSFQICGGFSALSVSFIKAIWWPRFINSQSPRLPVIDDICAVSYGLGMN